jgi:hypothetical protein
MIDRNDRAVVNELATFYARVLEGLQFPEDQIALVKRAFKEWDGDVKRERFATALLHVRNEVDFKLDVMLSLIEDADEADRKRAEKAE